MHSTHAHFLALFSMILYKPPLTSMSNAFAKLLARVRASTSAGTQNSAESRRSSSLGARLRRALRPAGRTGAMLLRLREPRLTSLEESREKEGRCFSLSCSVDFVCLLPIGWRRGAGSARGCAPAQCEVRMGGVKTSALAAICGWKVLIADEKQRAASRLLSADVSSSASLI